MFEIKPLSEAYIEELAELAVHIFRHYYTGMISDAQIDYMLAMKNFAPANYRKILQSDDPRSCHIALCDGKVSGYTIFMPAKMEDMGDGIFVRRIYVDQEHRGKGIGRGLLDSIEGRPIRLRVFRHNNASIAFYERYGFVKYGENIKDIGQGFVMDDYLMRYDKPHSAS